RPRADDPGTHALRDRLGADPCGARDPDQHDGNALRRVLGLDRRRRGTGDGDLHRWRHRACERVRAAGGGAKAPDLEQVKRHAATVAISPLRAACCPSAVQHALRYWAPSCFARAITLSATAMASRRPASMSLR